MHPVDDCLDDGGRIVSYVMFEFCNSISSAIVSLVFVKSVLLCIVYFKEEINVYT